MAYADRILMGPGPGNPYPEVMEAFGRPVLGHLDPDFIALLDEINERLRQVFRTANPLTFPVSATGSAGMEATFVNVLGPGDVVTIGVNGVFGTRMSEVASRAGAEVTRVDAEWGRILDPAAMIASAFSSTTSDTAIRSVRSHATAAAACENGIHRSLCG